MTQRRHSADEPPLWRPTSPRAAATNGELRQQIIELHQLGADRSSTASPLARQLIETARRGTYERLAPLIADVDPAWDPASSSAARTQPSAPIEADEPDPAKAEARRRPRGPKFMTKLLRRDS